MNDGGIDASWEKSFQRPFVTYALCLLCGLMYLLQSVQGGKDLAYPGYVDGVDLTGGEYWGLLVSFFLHGSLTHVAFNLYWIYYFGSVVEPHIGWRRYLLFWLGAVIFSGMVEYSFTGQTGVGASGFGYALFGLVWVGSKSRRYLAEILNANTVALFILWFFGCIALTWMGTMSVANGAHAGGFLFGALCAYAFWMRDSFIWKRVTIAVPFVSLLPLFYAPWLGTWNLAQGEKAYDHEKYDRALTYLDNIKVPGYDLYILQVRGMSLSKLGRNGEAAAIYREVLSQKDDVDDSTLEYIYNDYAWILATSPDDKLRDPAQAIQYAQKACEMNKYKDDNALDTLAAAYAADGQFDQAVAWEQKAIDADAGAPAQDIQDLKDHLKLFQDKKPYREIVTRNGVSNGS